MPTRVLIVEDDENVRAMFGLALRVAGFETSAASTAMEALERIDTNPPDAVILDIGLPVFSGAVVREELTAHAHTRDIPVIVVTGSQDDLASLHASCVLRKPVGPRTLVEALRGSAWGRGPRRDERVTALRGKTPQGNGSIGVRGRRDSIRAVCALQLSRGP